MAWFSSDQVPSKEDIEDKCKADGLVKSIAAVQFLWFLTSTLARIVEGLPITTLELSTLAYIPGTMLAIAYWWSKPCDVGEPMLVSTPGKPLVFAAGQAFPNSDG